MEKHEIPFPDYEKPPVAEVVFGIQFKELVQLKTPHMGILWEKLGRADYPECEEAPPIAHIIESFDGKESEQAVLHIEAFDRPPLPSAL
jgi:uncharacterized protein (TIGR04255 family)